MSQRKYQVFLSSTYSDLVSERDAITRALYEMSCIPIGMEAFPATDEEQLSFIKRMIDDTDYYILLIGARYGSIDGEGISYTEREYEYAKQRGVPVLAFVHEDPQSLGDDKSDLKDAAKAEQFYRFRNEVTASRMVKMWADSSSLSASVVLALNRAIADFPRVGWVRNEGPSNEDTLQRLVETQSELAAARTRLSELELKGATATSVEGLKVRVNLTIKAYERTYQSSVISSPDIHAECDLEKLFAVLGPNILEPLNQDGVSNILALEAAKGQLLAKHVEYKFLLERESLNTIRIQLESLGLIQVQYSKTMGGSMANFWTATATGKAETYRLRTIKD